MCALPKTIAPKLAKLLPLLGSDKDAEALGAARAIQRTLASEGCDLHDLAASLDRPEPPRASHSDRAWWVNDPPALSAPRSLACFLLNQRTHRLSGREREFLLSLLDASREPSPKKLGWLRDIRQRAIMEPCS